MNGKCIYDGRRCFCTYNSYCATRVKRRQLYNFLAAVFFLLGVVGFVVACLGAGAGTATPFSYVISLFAICVNAFVAHIDYWAATRR